jgi:hypothetical protein
VFKWVLLPIEHLEMSKFYFGAEVKFDPSFLAFLEEGSLPFYSHEIKKYYSRMGPSKVLRILTLSTCRISHFKTFFKNTISCANASLSRYSKFKL